MSKPTLCMIHEVVGHHGAISKIAMDGVNAALAAGWDVSVVAKYLDESLRGRVEWLRLTVPPRGFLLQWLTARHFIRRALGVRSFDVVHAHQPQVAGLADVFQCHFLTRVAHERGCLESRPGLRPAVIRLQQRGVLHAEDYFYRRWNPHTRMLFCSELVEREFGRLYGPPPRGEVFPYAFRPLAFVDEPERGRARQQVLGGQWDGLVLGYIGGVDERKGYKRLVRALEGEREIMLLMGGPYTAGFDAPALSGHMRAVGLVTDVATFYAACDAVVVPSVFDPSPLVVFEAAARGVPVIATAGVGNLPMLLAYEAGAAWQGAEPLGPLVRRVAADRERHREGARRMADDLGAARYATRLLDVYDRVRRERAQTREGLTTAADAARLAAGSTR